MTPVDLTAIGEIAARRHVRLLLQHGSTVSGHVHPGSDVDLAALFEDDDVSLGRVIALGEELQAFFPGREIDVATINHADPLFLKRILDQFQLLHGSTRALAELRIYAFKRYQDHRRFLALERAYVRRSLDRMATRQSTCRSSSAASTTGWRRAANCCGS